MTHRQIGTAVGIISLGAAALQDCVADINLQLMFTFGIKTAAMQVRPRHSLQLAQPPAIWRTTPMENPYGDPVLQL